MIDKKQLDKQIDLIAYDILDNVISPLCNIPKRSIWADPFMANIGCYVGHRDKEISEEDEGQEVINAICEKYGIKSLYKTNDHYVVEIKPVYDEEFESPICVDWSLATIALYILLHGNRPDFYKECECDFCNIKNSCITGPYDNLICLDCDEKFSKGEIE